MRVTDRESGQRPLDRQQHVTVQYLPSCQYHQPLSSTLPVMHSLCSLGEQSTPHQAHHRATSYTNTLTLQCADAPRQQGSYSEQAVES